MKKILAVLLFMSGFLLAGLLTAQAQLPAGYVEVPHRPSIPTRGPAYGIAPCSIRENGVYDAERLRTLFNLPGCEESIKAMNLDLTKQTLVGYNVRSDCHMRVQIRTFRSDLEKKYLTVINNIYGGCRAGGGRSGWIVLDKLPEGYTLEVKEVKVDGIHGPNVDGFQFPKQPTGIAPEVLESREIDIRGCLPMTGQSQWVFINKDFLQAGLERFPETLVKCSAYFAELDIDFSKYDLAGYNLTTGDCHRPLGLEQRVVKDYDEMVYRLELTYPKPEGRCHIRMYHPVWVLVPKPVAGYSFRIVSFARGQ